MSSNESYEHSYYKTFSGTDSLAFMLLPDCKPILLGSLTTISYSMYRDKKPVTLIGKVNVSGYTRGMRVIAGTMIFTLINQHLTKDLLEQVPYLAAHGKIKADELPLFDIMIISANEYGASTRMMIYGIDITDDAQVLSIQDLFTENTFNFVARDLDEFTAQKVLLSSGSRRSLKTLDAIMPYDLDIDAYEQLAKMMLENIKNDELITVQTELVRQGDLYKVTGVYDNETTNAIKKVQSRYNLKQTGILDDTTFDLIMTSISEDSRKVITISSSSGAFVYQDKDMSKVNGIAKHKESFLSYKDGDFYKIMFFGLEGYIHKSDVENRVDIDISLLSPMGVIEVNDRDYSKIGMTLIPSEDIDVKISAISYYGKNRDSFSKYIKVSGESVRTISLKELSDAYIYNMAYKKKPDRVVFIILSQDSFICKWDVRLGGDNNGNNQ